MRAERHAQPAGGVVGALPWPSQVPMPADWSVVGHEDQGLLSIAISAALGTAAMVIDLETHERVTEVHADSAAAFVLSATLRQLAADRDRFDRRKRLPRRERRPIRIRQPQTWTPLQKLAFTTGGTWHAPITRLETERARAAARYEFVRVNRAIQRVVGKARR